VSAKQDRQGVRTAADVERKYNLGNAATPGYVQSLIKDATAAVASEMRNYVDGKVKVPEMLVVVEADSLSTESLVSDKSYAEIEAAVLSGMSVRVKLVCQEAGHNIYLRLAEHLPGQQMSFYGQCCDQFLVLQIVKDQLSETTE